ncbi:GntR family transcriptional regulator (plasmid) [Rhizobium sp. CB3060]|uniref:GntR family transcriptional regulator n=1 Tax=Rhizobium sp. CB3060 TaxID=3138255 RepID=UPI0021A56379|nr:GntR family transcriptional regulator [Rhizobium tropici]UWU25492.1 GntR family transcriptional regulator [Rhizobium tropici]
MQISKKIQLGAPGATSSAEVISLSDPGHDTGVMPGQSLSDRVREAIEAMIIGGQMLPGSRIDEAELTQKFKVSRTPMREAIKALIATGLLESRPRQGVTVAALSTPVLLEMFDAMSMLEGMCAKYAARRATFKQIAQLEEIQDRLEKAFKSGDPEGFYVTNLDFHEVIYCATHTTFLAEQTRSLRKRVAMYWKHVTYLPGRMAETVPEHQCIIAAIKAKDPKAAELAGYQHISLLGDNMIDFIARLPRAVTSDQ